MRNLLPGCFAAVGRSCRSAFIFALLCLTAHPALVHAQDAGGAGQKHLALVGVPSATIAPNGTFFATLSGSTRRSPTEDGLDGSAALGFGLGSAEKGVGVQVSAHVTSLTNEFGDSGYLALKFARRITGGAAPTYVGLSLDHIANWGDAAGRDPGATVAVTTFSQVRLGAAQQSFPVILSLGAGSHLRKNQTKPGVFVGAGIGLTRSFGASMAWTGDAVDVGASFRFDGAPNLGVTASLADAFDMQNNRRLNLSVSWVLKDAFGR